MEKIKNYLDSNNYLRIIFVLMIFFWTIPYLLQNVDAVRYEKCIHIIENIEIGLIGIIVCLLLVIYPNTFYVVPLVLLTPFIFSRPFDIYTTPICIYISSSLMVIGIIINFIKFKPKLKEGHFLFGLCFLGLAMTFGGINISSDYLFEQIIYIALIAIAFIIMYLYFSSTILVRFETIARLMTYLGVFLLFQLGVYFILQEDTLLSMLQKKSDVGWGISNNIALMLLFTAPFTLYLALINKRIKCALYIAFVAFQFMGIIFTYSRGSIISMLVGFVALIPLSIWKAKDKKILLITAFSILFLMITSLTLIYYYKHHAFELFKDVILNINWSSLNGRTGIYERTMEILRFNPIFGKGVFSLYDTSLTTEVKYAWGHSTLLHTLETMGLLGVCALFVHMFEKYYSLLRKPELWKVLTAFGLALSDLYGLFDVSYYFINYMVVLVLVLCMIDKLIIDKPKMKEHKNE